MKPSYTADMQFEDSENHSGSENISIQQIVMKNLQHCIQEGSKEMDGGGYRRRFLNNEVVEIFVPNQREVFCNSVDMLWVLVLPFYHKSKNEEIKKRIDTVTTQLNELAKSTAISLNQKYKWVSLPQPGVIGSGKAEEEFRQQMYDKQVHVLKCGAEFKEQERVRLYRSKLIAISQLLKTLDYFEEGGYSN